MSDEYICTLDAATEAKAKLELNEDPKERLGAVEALRQWVLQQPHLKYKPDTIALLSFLRTAKFSQLRAREMIDSNLTVTTKYPEWFKNIDSRDPELLKVIDSGYVIPLPKRDRNGCGILIYRMAATLPDGKLATSTAEVRVDMIAGLYCAQVESVQVNGLVFILDLTGYGTKHWGKWSLEDMRKYNHCWQHNMPGRFKAFHVYNAGAIIDTVMTITRPMLTKKMQDRIHMHDTLESLYRYVGTDLLPSEYLPDDYQGESVGSLQQLIENFKNTVTSPEARQKILEVTSDKYGVDESKRSKVSATKESFRKLTVD